MLRIITVALVLVMALTASAWADQTDINPFSVKTVNLNNVTTASITAMSVGGNDRLLVVGISLANGATSVSSVNYNPGTGNVALTPRVVRTDAATNVRVEIWTLTAPRPRRRAR